MGPITCAGCNQRYTHASYSRHISMTQCATCRAIYDHRVDLPVGRENLEDSHHPSKCLCQFDHASRLTPFQMAANLIMIDMEMANTTWTLTQMTGHLKSQAPPKNPMPLKNPVPSKNPTSLMSLCKKESQLQSKKTDFSQEKSRKSQFFWLFFDFSLTFLDWNPFFLTVTDFLFYRGWA